MELRHTRVLILVHDDIAEAVLVIFPRFCVILQQLDRVEDQVVKVHCTCGFQTVGVGGIDFGDQLRLGIGRDLGSHFLCGHELILIGRNLPDGRLDRQEFVVNHQIFINLLDDALLVVRVVDGKAFGKADSLGVTAQHPHTSRVKGRRIDVAAQGVPQHSAQALFQLPRRFVRKGNGKHVPGACRAHGQIGGLPGQVTAIGDGSAQVVEVSFGHSAGQLTAAVGRAKTDDVGNAVDQHGGFAGACARQNQQRTFGGKDSLPLYRVEPGKAGLDILIAQGEIFSGDVGHGKSFRGVFAPLLCRGRVCPALPWRENDCLWEGREPGMPGPYTAALSPQRIFFIIPHLTPR